jgi:putative tryptophan/tyrosine transport system substrate-binding protein
MEGAMDKKLLCLALITTLASVFPAEAQQPKKVSRIGVLSGGTASSNASRIQAFRQGLRDLGYVEGQNVTIEYRYTEGLDDRIPNLAAELVQLKVDVIITAGTPATQAANNATKAIPIVTHKR